MNSSEEKPYHLDRHHKTANKIILAQLVFVPDFKAKHLQIGVVDSEFGGFRRRLPHGIEAVVVHGVGVEPLGRGHAVSAGECNLKGRFGQNMRKFFIVKISVKEEQNEANGASEREDVDIH
jgi:hypothetical protein